jgi:hypothetical protein
MKTEEELEQLAQENETTLEGLLTERPLIAHDNSTLVNMIMAMEVGLENPDVLWAEMGEVHKQIILAIFQAAASREIQLRE